MTSIPAVPYLRSGTGKTPAEGGCIMQVIDWIHSGGWTDQPTCVHPILRGAAIKANDSLADDQRQGLLNLTSRLMGTNTGEGRVLSRRLLEVIVDSVVETSPVLMKRVPHCAEAAALYKEICADPENQQLLHRLDEVISSLRDALRMSALRLPADLDVRRITASGAFHDLLLTNFDACEVGFLGKAHLDFTAAFHLSGLYGGHPMVLLVRLLDEFEKVTGREPSADPVDYSGVCEILATA